MRSLSGARIIIPALEAENARTPKEEALHGALDLAVSREAAGRKLRAIDAIVVVWCNCFGFPNISWSCLEMVPWIFSRPHQESERR
jgi:hypothetical protein